MTEGMARLLPGEDDDKWATPRFVPPLNDQMWLEEESSNEDNYLDNVNSFGATYHDHGKNKFWEAREDSGWNLQKPMAEYCKLAAIMSEETYLLDTGATCHVTNSDE